jgi:hypothetical protein
MDRMEKRQRHHIIARSRGGTDDYVEWKSPYDHAYDHAIDFVLFERAPMFDCRSEGWKMLPKDLREAVLSELAIRGSELGRSNVESGHLEKISTLGGKTNGGKYFTDEGRRKANLTKISNGHYSKAGKSQGKWVNTHPDYPPFESTASGLHRWQKKRNIGPLWREKRED